MTSHLRPVLAGAAMAASSVSVVANSLLMNFWRPKELPPRLPEPERRGWGQGVGGVGSKDWTWS